MTILMLATTTVRPIAMDCAYYARTRGRGLIGNIDADCCDTYNYRYTVWTDYVPTARKLYTQNNRIDSYDHTSMRACFFVLFILLHIPLCVKNIGGPAKGCRRYSVDKCILITPTHSCSFFFLFFYFLCIS